MSDSNGTEQAARRLTLADAYRDAQHVIDQLTTRTSTEPSASVELSRNAKGDAQFSVKVYAPASADPDEVRRATEHAYQEAVSAFDGLGTLYPMLPKPEPDAKKAAAK